MSGLLVLIVGPSGSGKDTLLAGAARALARDPRFVFARRIVTRAAANEDHESTDVPTFLARLRQGAFALHWQAHGLHYGVPAAALAPLATGAVVVANVSRGVIVETARRFPTIVIEITAPDALRAARLASRGRETEADIAERLSRQVAPPVDVARHSLVNDGSIAQGVLALAALLESVAADAKAPSAG